MLRAFRWEVVAPVNESHEDVDPVVGVGDLQVVLQTPEHEVKVGAVFALVAQNISHLEQ